MTILIPIFDSFIAKNILRTDVLRTLLEQKDLRVVLCVDSVRASEYRSLFGSERVVVAEVNPDPRSKFEHRWTSLTWHVLSSETLRAQLRGGPLSPHRGLFERCAIHILVFLFNNPFGRSVLRFLDYHTFTSKTYMELFDTYEPSLVFATNVFAPLDIELMREAHQRGIRTLGMVKSWDNVSSKGLIRHHPDHMIVHTEVIARELRRYADYPRKKISVVGVPQYDIYFRPDTEDRMSFWRRYGVDGSKKVILYLEPGGVLAPHGHELWPLLEKYLAGEGRQEAVETFISIHPAYRVPGAAAKQLKQIKIVRFGYRINSIDYKSWELGEDALLDLMRAVRYCDLVIATGSTMNIESSIFDKPIINIAFDGNISLPYSESVRQYYDYTHLLPIVRSGGVKVAHSPDELFENINFLLEHPEWGRDGRKRIVEEQCVYTDGRSAKRVADVVLAHIQKTRR